MNYLGAYLCCVLSASIFFISSQCAAATAKVVQETRAEQIARLKKYHLDQIQLAANEFIDLENKNRHTDWKVTEVNLKTFVPNCSVPLTAAWAPRDRVYRKSVRVVCSQSVSPRYKKWDVYLAVYKPKSKQDKIK